VLDVRVEEAERRRGVGVGVARGQLGEEEVEEVAQPGDGVGVLHDVVLHVDVVRTVDGDTAPCIKKGGKERGRGGWGGTGNETVEVEDNWQSGLLSSTETRRGGLVVLHVDVVGAVDGDTATCIKKGGYVGGVALSLYTIFLLPILYGVRHTKGRSRRGRISPKSRATVLLQCG